MTAKQAFSRIGCALFVTTCCFAIVSIGAGWAAAALGAERDGWLKWLLAFAPVYLVAFPLGYLVLRRVPADGREGSALGIKDFFVSLLICFPVMYAGSLLGTLLSWLLSGGAAENPLTDLVFDTSFIKPLVMVVFAPLLEEWFFRKQLIDRTVRYGEKTAILLSALAFALVHGNLFQIFYAFGLGLVFSYVYVRTRRLRYPVLLHMAVNFMGSVIAPLVLSAVDADALELGLSGTMDKDALMALLPGLAALALYGLAMIGLSVAGLVLLILRARKLMFLTAEEELPKESRFRTVYGNAGMIMFILLCLLICSRALFLS